MSEPNVVVTLEFRVMDHGELVRTCKRIPEEQRLWDDEEIGSIPTADIIRETLLHLDVISGGSPISFCDIGIALQN